MADREPDDASADASSGGDTDDPLVDDRTAAEDPESLRAAVEAKYDFEDFRPADMAEMTVEEWEAAFDPDTWITGDRLVDRVEAELLGRIAAGELFAVVERHDVNGVDQLLVYTDAGYAVVTPDGTVEGEGSIASEIEPVVALCSMESFEVADPPPDAGLPDPATVEPGSGDLGHRLLLAVAGIQLVAGLVVLVSPVLVRLGPGAAALTSVVGLAFIGDGVLLGVLVANARLSDRFRAAEYRDRLQAAGVGSDERPSFLPRMDGDEGEADAVKSGRQ
jgi:hypothetical protein